MELAARYPSASVFTFLAGGVVKERGGGGGEKCVLPSFQYLTVLGVCLILPQVLKVTQVYCNTSYMYKVYFEYMFMDAKPLFPE